MIGFEESQIQIQIRFLSFLRKITRRIGVGIGIGEHCEDSYVYIYIESLLLEHVDNAGRDEEQQVIIVIHHTDSIIHMRYRKVANDFTV